MIKEELLDMAEELRQILGAVDGVERLEEELVLNYLIVVSDDSKRENATKVGDAMAIQAQNHGLTLEISITTEKELQEVRDKLIQHMKENKTFGEG